MEELKINISDIIEKRVFNRLPQKLFEFLMSNNINNFYVAGNCLNVDKPNDIDIFPVNKNDFNNLNFNNKSTTVLFKTPNATTIKIDNVTIQFCNYYHSSLKSLVDSFDFAHIQVGVKLCLSNLLEVGIFDNSVISSCREIYYSLDWEKSHLIESTYYIHSGYPLSSLIRLIKYAKRDNFNGKNYIYSIVSILNDIISRGFTSYADFKDQLDSIDLGLIQVEGVDKEEDTNNSDIFYTLFTLLSKDKDTVTIFNRKDNL